MLTLLRGILTLWITTACASQQREVRRGSRPIMGWNNCQIDCATWAPDDALIRSTALALNRSGLASAGYVHLNMDDAWMAANRTPDGLLQPNMTRFPDWLATLAFVRSLGLSVGLYTAAGDKTCSGKAGSCRHEVSDAQQFVGWGITHVKDDACSTCRDPNTKGSPDDYAAMVRGLRAAATTQGLPSPLLMVEGQPPFPEAADGNHGDVRRVGHDINPAWISILSLIDLGSGLWVYAGSSQLGGKRRHAFFNDLEMMELGNGDFRAKDGPGALARTRAHMTMWAIMKSPLVLSTDLNKLDQETLEIALNRVAIEVNQDSLGEQARRVKSDSPTRRLHTQQHHSPRQDSRDVVAVAALCDKSRPTQRWFWAETNRTTDHVNMSTDLRMGALFTLDSDGWGWCLAMPYSGVWSVVPYSPGNQSEPTRDASSLPPCLSNGQVSAWIAKPVQNGEDEVRSTSEYAFIWQTGNRPYGFGWGQDLGSSGPLPHTRWLQSNAAGTWVTNLDAASKFHDGGGASFSPPHSATVIDDNGVGGVTARPGSDFCLDVILGGGNVETWMGALEGGRAVAAVLNRSPEEQNATVQFSDVGINASRVNVHSAWGEPGNDNRNGTYSVQVPGHGAALLILDPKL